MLAVWLYVPHGTNIDAALGEALAACRGDWVCARTLVEAGVAKGQSVKRLWRSGRMLYVELDEDRFRGVAAAGRNLSMVAPNRVTPGFATGVPDALRDVLYRALLVLAGVKEDLSAVSSPEDVVELIRKLEEPLARLLSVAREKRGEISGGVSTAGQQEVRYAYRVASSESGYEFVLVAPNATTTKSRVTVTGSHSGCEYTVDYGVVWDGMIGIRMLKLKCSRDADPETAARLAVQALAHAASRLFIGAREEAPPPGLRSSRTGKRFDLGLATINFDLTMLLGYWLRAGVPLRRFDAHGRIPDMLVPGPAPSEKEYGVSFEVLGPRGERIGVEIGGGTNLVVAYRGVKTTVPDGAEIEVREGENRGTFYTHASATMKSNSVETWAKPGHEQFMVYALLAALDTLRWLDRYKPKGDMAATIRVGGTRAWVEKRETGWVADVYRHDKHSRITAASFEELVEKLVLLEAKHRESEAQAA